MIKQAIFLAYAAIFLTFSMAFLSGRMDEPDPAESTAPPELRESTPAPVFSPSPSPEASEPAAEEAEPAAADCPAPQRISVLHAGEVYEVDIQDYLTGVVAAEMPADFEPEALKAQAVAARTYALYCASSGRHGDADVCTDFSCCQAWESREDMERGWGDAFDGNYERIRSAVEGTAGEYLCYDGQAVFAAFHSSSAGATEDCGAIWNELPYLVSVSSPESEDTVPGFVSRLEQSPLDFRDTLLYAHPEADFSGSEDGWIGELRRDDSGRVACAVLGGVEFSGTELRELFSLRSTAFTLSYSGGSFVFTVTGFGHGVGMSQYGANVMASRGADYREILSHYYPGTVLVK